jgi:hypothetical protein
MLPPYKGRRPDGHTRRPSRTLPCFLSAVLFVSLVAETQQSDRATVFRSCGLRVVEGLWFSLTSCARARKSGGNKAQPTHKEELPKIRECSRRPSSMAVGTPALVGGQHVVIRPEMSPHASAVLFVSDCVGWQFHGHMGDDL